MCDLISRLSELRCQYNCFDENERDAYHTLSEAIKALSDAPDTNVGDTIYRQAAIDALGTPHGILYPIRTIESLPAAQPGTEKYEYHYDHTDCIWYRPEARNRCPATCAQYRDGWNDAMNYIFRDGKGYRPYRRDKQYEG